MIPAYYPVLLFIACMIALAMMLATKYLKRIRNPFAWGAICILVAFGGSKHGQMKLWSFVFQNGLYDAGSFCTNDTVCARWTFDVAAAENTVRASYQDMTVTNANGICVDEFHPLEECPVSASNHVWTVANATNLRIVVYSTYVPPVVIQTNGVYHLGGVMRSLGGNGKFVTPGTPLVVDLEDGQRETITPTNFPASVTR